MNNSLVRIVDESVAVSSRQAITGIIYFDFGAFQFPEDTWNDFVVVLLGWWLSATIELATGGKDVVEFRFMDGPLCAEVAQLGSGMLSVKCLLGHPRRIHEETRLPLVELERSILLAARRVDRICQERSWASEDVLLLRDRLKVLEEIVGSTL